MSETEKELIDITLLCKDCSRDFIWTKGEQKFLHTLLAKGMIKDKQGNSQDYIDEPKRCPTCRQKKKARFAKIEEDKRAGQDE